MVNQIKGIIIANDMYCVIISKKEDELYNIRVRIIIAQRNVKT